MTTLFEINFSWLIKVFYISEMLLHIMTFQLTYTAVLLRSRKLKLKSFFFVVVHSLQLRQHNTSERSYKTVSRLASRRFSPKMNKPIFFCFTVRKYLKLKIKIQKVSSFKYFQTVMEKNLNLFVRFLGIYGAPICFWFHLTFRI